MTEQKKGYVTGYWVVGVLILGVGALMGMGITDITGRVVANERQVQELRVDVTRLQENYKAIQESQKRIEEKLDKLLSER